MGLVDKIRNYAVKKGYYKDEINDVGVDNYDDDYEDMEDVDVVSYKRRSKPAEDSRMTLPPLRQREEYRPVYAAPDSSDGPKVRSINQSVKRNVHHAAPKSIEEAGEICDHLINDDILSLNFESVDIASSQRVVDFLSGAAYSLGGSIHATGSRNFIVLPRNTEMSGQLEEELRAKGLFFDYKTAAK